MGSLFFSFFFLTVFPFFHFYLALFSGVLFSDKWGGYGGGTRDMFLLKAFISSTNVESDARMGGHIETNSECEDAGVEMGTCTDVFMLTLYKENTTVIHVV